MDQRDLRPDFCQLQGAPGLHERLVVEGLRQAPEKIGDPGLHGAAEAVQELPYHSVVKTTMIYTHVRNRGGCGVRRRG